MHNEIAVEDAAKRMGEDGVCVLDVRTPDERARGYIAGSENVDFHDGNFKSNIEKLDHSKTYIVHCRGGGRSGKTVTMMQELGFTACYNLTGGFNEWVKKGMRVVR